MAINKISEFPKVTPSAEDKILIEKNGEGGHINLSEMPVSSPVNTKITSEVNSLKSRIDNLVLNGGNSPDECVDARRNDNTSITYPSLKARLDAEHSELKGDLGDLSNDVIKSNVAVNVGTITNGKFINNDGTLVSDSNSAVTDFISVYADTNMQVNDCFLNGRRSICAYKSDKTYLSTLVTNRPISESTTQIAVPKDCAYIRITSKIDITPSVVYKSVIPAQMIQNKSDIEDINRKLTIDENAINEVFDRYITVSNSKVGKYINGNNGLEETAEDSDATDYLAVSPNSKIKATNLYLSNNRSLCEYDAMKNFIRCVIYKTNEETVEFITSENAKYIRATTKTGVLPSFVYIENIPTSDKFVKSIVQYDFELFRKHNIQFENIGIIDGKFIHKKNGLLGSSDESCATDFIEVSENSVIHFDDLFLVGNRSICAYDKDKNFVSSLISGTSDTSMDITINEGIKYIRVSGKVGIAPTLRYLTLEFSYIDDIKNGKYKEIDGIGFTNGKFQKWDGNVLTDDNSCITDYVNVRYGMEYKIINLYLYDNRSIVGFDANKKFVKSFINGSSLTEYSFTVDDSSIFYIRASGRYDICPKVFEKSMGLETIRNEVKKSCTKRPYSPVKKILTLIDDDGSSKTGMSELKTVCDELGVKCTFAVMTRLFEESSTILPFLKDLQADGFHICSHSHSHSNWYKDANDGSTMFTMEEVEKDLIKSLELLKINGFLDSDMLVYPGSSCTREGIDNIARKWVQCACTILGGNNTYGYTTEYMLARNKVSAGDYGTDIQWYADRLRNLEKEGLNWVIYYTHTGTSTDWDKDLIKSVLQSAIDDGWTVMPLNEAWKYRKYMFDMQNMFGI